MKWTVEHEMQSRAALKRVLDALPLDAVNRAFADKVLLTICETSHLTGYEHALSDMKVVAVMGEVKS